MPAAADPSPSTQHPPRLKKRGRWWRISLAILGVVLLSLFALRLALPGIVKERVIRTINQTQVYTGQIEDVDLHLWRGAYAIQGLEISKTTGLVPLPFITAKSVDLSIEWESLLQGSVVGVVVIDQPTLNFIDAADEAGSQAGENGPWLEIITDLFPLKINSVKVNDGQVTFHAYHKEPQVSLHASELEVQIDNLTNVRSEVARLITTISATGRVMDHAPIEFQMKLDPFSYYPTFELEFRMVGLDVTQLNSLTRAYGLFDYEYGWFDLVIDLKSTEGQLAGSVTPLFRHIQVINLRGDLLHGNILKLFWEALIGGVTTVFKNQVRDQFGTRIPITGSIAQPQPDILITLANVLHNAFVRAYLPKLPPDTDTLTTTPQPGLQFQTGSVVEPGSPGDDF